MKRVIDHLRDRIEGQVFGRQMPSLEELRRSQWSEEFETLMRNRLVMGAFRYGLLENQKGNVKWAMLPSIRRRLDLYEQTGNLETLVDVANLCMVEFLNPSIPGASWQPIDDGEHVERG